MCILFRKFDLSKALADVMSHQEEPYVKRVIIQILRQYAKSTTTRIDDAFVDEIEIRLLFPERYTALKRKVAPLIVPDGCVRFSGYEDE